MMVIAIDELTKLELIASQHAVGLFKAVDDNRQHLTEFLPWVDHIHSVADFANYIQHCHYLHERNAEVSFVILYDGQIEGRIGLHNIDVNNRHASIGYWLTKKTESKGVISRSCKAIISYAFTTLGLNRLEIRVAVGNERSHGVPKRLGFTQESIARQAEWMKTQFVDLVVYSLLANEFDMKPQV